MSKEQLSSKQIICLMIWFILGSNLVTGINAAAKQDAWISLIVSSIMAIPILLMFANFKTVAPDKDLYDMAYLAFGEKIGALISVIFVGYAIMLASMIIRDYTEFIQVVSLPETPQFINAVCIGLLSMYTLKKGMEIMARGAVFVFPVIIFTITMLVLLSIKHMDIDYLLPVFESDVKTIFMGALYNLTFPFAETVLFISVFPLVDSKKSSTKLYMTALLSSSVMFLIIIIRNILILGVPTIQSINFATYSAIGIINISDFITRMEVIVSGVLIISGLVKITICLYVACKGIAKIFKFDDYKKVISPVVLLMIAYSAFVFENVIHMFENIGGRKFYIFIVQLGLPLVVLIGAKIKLKKTAKSNSQ